MYTSTLWQGQIPHYIRKIFLNFQDRYVGTDKIVILNIRGDEYIEPVVTKASCCVKTSIFPQLHSSYFPAFSRFW